MNKKAIITVKSRVSVEDDLIEVITPGIFSKKRNEYIVEYDETKLSGMEGTKTKMIIKKDSFCLIRKGSTETSMLFDINSQSISLYKTPYGAMEVIINTKKIDIDVSDDGGAIDIFYELNIENQQKVETTLKVDIRVEN